MQSRQQNKEYSSNAAQLTVDFIQTIFRASKVVFHMSLNEQ